MSNTVAQKATIRNVVAGTLLASLALLSACAATPTPYQPSVSDSARGYSETKLEDSRYRISFKGNGVTNRETVENYLLFRAAELTLQSGYDTFTVVNRDTDADRTFTRDYYGPRFSYAYFSPRFGWVNTYDPFWMTPTNYHEITRYEAFAEIVMNKGPKGSNPSTFDAHQVSENLGPGIRRPA